MSNMRQRRAARRRHEKLLHATYQLYRTVHGVRRSIRLTALDMDIPFDICALQLGLASVLGIGDNSLTGRSGPQETDK